MKLTIEEVGNEYAVRLEDGDSIYPTTLYPTVRLAFSRALQLCNIGPVGPQLHPEQICLGEIINEANPTC